MAGAKGYSSYRGRGSKWKILLAILLVAVIAVAASVIYLEQFMVYSADGRRQIVLPWQTEGEEPPLADGQGDSEVQPEVDLVVREPESAVPETFTAFSLPARALTMADWQEALETWCAAHPGGVLICDEVGCGVTPLDRNDRVWREAVGRLCCELAARAEAVYRVHCGVGVRLK